jgi:hypothetical protein
LDKRKALFVVLDGGVGMGDDGGRDESAASRGETNYEIIIPAHEVPALVGVEAAKSTDEAHAVGLVAAIGVGRGYGGGAEVGGGG